MSKKLVSAALTATTLMWAVGVAALPVAQAQTAASLQAQIQALLAQIAQLQAQLGTPSSGAAMTSSYSYTKDLTLGSKGADVTALQQMLINDGYLTAVSKPTGYFGALTQKALAAYQAAKGISPAAGYFGPKTRAFVNSMSVSTTAGTTSAGTTATVTTTSGAQTTSGVAAPASGLAVSVASNNPVAGSLISGSSGGAARVPVLSVNFTAGTAGGVTVSELKFHKVGVLSDNSVSGAYLTQNGKVLYQYNSLNQGVLDFSGMSLNVPAGQTVTLTLAIDVSSGLSAGNTTAFSLNAASDVTAFDASNNAATPSGTFPVSGNTFMVMSVSNPSLATVTVASSSIGNQVTAGTQGNLVGAWNFQAQNSKVYLDSLNFHVIGSANKGDIRNVKLMVNGTQVGKTLATVGSDGTAYFDASAAPGVLNTGSNNVQIFADVMGSPSYNFQFEILNAYDVYAVDSQYSVPVPAGSNAGTQVSIQQGQITITQDTNTPTGNIAKGQSQITIAKFDIYAAGEAVKVQYLPFELDFAGVSTASDTALNQIIQNVAIVDDAGGQVGTTINQPPSANSPGSGGTNVGFTTSGAGASVTTGATINYTDSFGTASSPINYTVPANTTRVLSLRVDVQSTANFSQVTGKILQPAANNLQGLISSQLAKSSGAQGSTLSLAASSLTAAQNNALGTQTVSAGTPNVEIGSYSLAASSAEGVNINNLTVQVGSASPVVFQNLKVMVNGAQFGTTQSTVAPSGQYTFSGAPFTVSAGNTVNVNVYADTLSSASGTTSGGATSLTGLSGTGAISFSAISLASAVTGQSLSFAGSQTMSIAADSSQPAATTLTMGSTGNILAVYRLQETSNVGQVKVTDLTVSDTATSSASSTLAAFSNLRIYGGSNGQTLLGTAGAASAGTATSIVTPAVAFVAATGTITSTLAATSTAAVFYVTIGGVQVAGQIAVNSTSSQIANAIAATITANKTALGVSSAVASSSVVTVTSSGSATTTMSIFDTAGNGYTVSANGLSGGVAAVPAVTTTTSNGAYNYAFHFASPILVPQSNVALITLKGDASSYSAGGSTDNSKHSFSLTSSNVTALGATAGLSVTVSGAGSGNQMTVLRSTMMAATSPSSFTQNGKQPLQEIGSVTLTANNSGPVMLKSLNLNFSGSNVTGTALTGFLATVVLKGQNSVDVTIATSSSGLGALVATGTNAGVTTATSTWTFATTTANGASPLVVSPGSPITLQLWGTTNVIPAISNQSESLSVTLQNTTDVQYYDGTDAAAVSTGALSLPTTAVPLTVSSFSYGTGQ